MSKCLIVACLATALLCVPSDLLAKEVSVGDRLDQVAEVVHARIKPSFSRQRIDYPPERLMLVAVKDEKRVKVFAPDITGDWKFILQYQIAKISGTVGPKLRAGDKQVPEGIYNVTHLNPQSKYWLSLALNYPNTFDREKARKDKRTKLGGDIMLHGWWFSDGCVAVGNAASEDLFVMAQEVGLDNIKVIITPTDFRSDTGEFKSPEKPAWVPELYDKLKDELNELGSEGMTTDTRLIAYADIAPPPPPEPESLLSKVLLALIQAAETSSTKETKSE